MKTCRNEYLYICIGCCVVCFRVIRYMEIFLISFTCHLNGNETDRDERLRTIDRLKCEKDICLAHTYYFSMLTKEAKKI